MLQRVICVLIGYLCGLFQTSYLYGRLKHIDIREYGSGNAGATNALRTLGKKAGLLTFLGDFLKPMAAMALVWLLFHQEHGIRILLLELLAGSGAFFGHVFPFYLNFRGGKGIATLAGVGTWFAVASGIWYIVIISIAVFLLVAVVSKYVSLASLSVLAAYFIQIIVMGQLGMMNIESQYRYEIYVIFFCLFALAYYKHRANIKRLVKGTENKLGQRKQS